ncbi:MAG: hypothetical protein IKO41_06115 [Lachnospiraceae bacterium]|nr:hypothetical protein [Desulfovibrio sp.]MBR4605785.1 hypothetical protein [Lachnospiraceae bacterium]
MSAYDWAEKDRLDRYAHQAFWGDKVKKGEMIGEQKGDRERQIKVARKVLAKNVPIEDIADFTDLPISKSKELSSKR